VNGILKQIGETEGRILCQEHRSYMMKPLLNIMQLCYYNIKNVHDLYCKEKYLNRFLILLKHNNQMMKFLTNQYFENPEEITNYITSTNQEYLILLTGDVNLIQKYIDLPDNMYLTFYDNSFHIEFNQDTNEADNSWHSPQSTQSVHSVQSLNSVHSPQSVHSIHSSQSAPT
jgi:hypothetical protein